MSYCETSIDNVQKALRTTGIIPQPSVSSARCTLADATSRLSPNTVGSARMHGFTARPQLLGPFRKTLAKPSADRELHATVFHQEL